MTKTEIICPYCQQEQGDKKTCCGKSEFVEVPLEEDDEVENVTIH